MRSSAEKSPDSRRAVRSRRSESGDTLIEVLLTIMVLGLASVAVLLALATTISGSAEHRNLTTMDTVLRTAAEQVISEAQQASSTQFGNCPTTSSPTSGNTDLSGLTMSPPLPTYYSWSVTSAAYWSSVTSDFSGACVPSTANVPQVNSPQLVSLTITYAPPNTASTSSSISFVVNDPQARGVPSPGTETHLAFITPVAGTSYVAGVGFPSDTQPVIAVEDANNRVVTSDGLPPVTLSLNQPSGTTGASLANCAASVYGGVVSFSNCSINVAANGYTLTATDPLLTGAGKTPSTTSSTFNVTAAQPSQFTFTSSPASGVASSTALVGPITVQEQDAFGNPTTAAETVNLSSNSSGTAVFAATPGGTAITSISIPAGSSTATFYYGDTAAGSPTITASGSLTSDTQAESIVGAPGTQLVFTTSPSSTTVSTKNFATQPVITVEDAFGNVSTGDTSTVTLALSSGTAGATLSSSCVGSETSGVVSFSGCSVDKVGTGYILTASDGQMTAATSNPFAITVGLPAQWTITSAPLTGAASSTTALGPITVQEQDAGGNPTTKSEVVNLSSNSSGTKKFVNSGGSTITSISIPTGSSTGTFFYLDTLAGTPTITVSGSSLISDTQTETITSGSATKLVFSPATPGPGIAGSPIPNVVVQAQDSNGNVATSASGSVGISVKSGSAQPAFTSGTYSVSLSSGIATFSDLTVNAAGTYTLTATPAISGVSGTYNSNSFAVSAAPVSIFAMSTPVAQTAGTAFSETLTAKDAFGNTITGYTGTKTIVFTGPSNSPSPSPNGTAPTYPATVSFTSGVGTASITLFDAQTTTLTATQGSITGTSGSFTVASSTVAGGTISTPSAPTAGTAFNETIAATDTYGNTVTSFSGAFTVTFSGPANSPSPANTAPIYPPSVTFASGVATASVKLFDAQTTTLTATLSGVPLTTGSFTVAPATANDFTVTTPGTQAAGTAFNETITAIDPYDNTATGYSGSKTIVFTGPSNSPSPSNTAPSYPSSVTFTAGVGTASITLFDAQNTTLTATQGTLTQPTNLFTVASVLPSGVTLSNGTLAGKADFNDKATITFPNQLNASTLCSGWSNSGTLTQTTSATITLTNTSSSNDTFAVTSATSCTGGGNFGTVATGGNYLGGTVGSTVNFTSSSVTWNPTNDTLTFTLGNPSGTLLTGVTAGDPGYKASGTPAKDVYGNVLTTTQFTSSTTSRF
jgi:type II secretory pathway pseudopilin PulG